MPIHYSPFGLTMAGISSKALVFGDPGNKRKYNGIEFENALGIDEYEAQLRNLDPQVGRWWEIDPKIENQEAWSPYVSNNDNPVKYSDPLGDEADDCCKELWGDIKSAAKETWGSIKQGGSDLYNNVLLPATDWVNHNVNPVYGVFNGVNSQFTGKDFLAGTPMTHADGAADVVLSALPGAKIEGALIKTGEKALLGVGERHVLKTSLGTEITGFTNHGLNRVIERGVKPGALKDALKSPLEVGKIIKDLKGRPSQRYIGKMAEVAINPKSGKILSANVTGTKKAAKLIANSINP